MYRCYHSPSLQSPPILYPLSKSCCLREGRGYVFQSKYMEIICQSHRIIGWKRPLRSSRPTIHPTPPCLLNHVPKCHIYTFFGHLQGWWLHHFPGQPVPVPDHSFSKDIFPNIQSRWLSTIITDYSHAGYKGKPGLCAERAGYNTYSCAWLHELQFRFAKAAFFKNTTGTCTFYLVSVLERPLQVSCVFCPSLQLALADT